MPLVREQAAQLAHDHGQRLVPGRGRCLAPQGLGELVPRHRPALLGHQIREQEPTLPPREALLVDHHAVGLDCDPTREENLQLATPRHSLTRILPRFRGAFLISPRGVVDKVLHCDCGFEARAADEDGLVAEVQRHAREAHGMALSHDEALLLAFRAELDEEAPTTIPRETTTRTEEKEER